MGASPRCGFPNPEEPGALDLAVALARERVPTSSWPTTPTVTGWLWQSPPVTSGGNSPATRSGCLMADHILRNRSRQPDRRPSFSRAWCPPHSWADRRRPQRSHWGADTHRVRVDLERCAGAPGRGEGSALVFGFEEALGYSVGQVVRDKDGISAAVVFADLSAEADTSGVTLWDLLADLAERHGLWVSAQHSVT